MVDLGFNFLTDAIKLDTKKWHYPCITRIDCSITTEPTTDYLAVAAMMGELEQRTENVATSLLLMNYFNFRNLNSYCIFDWTVLRLMCLVHEE